MASAKKAKVYKDEWKYAIDSDEESYSTFPSYDAALKAARSEVKDNYSDSYSYGRRDGNPLTVKFYQLAKVVDFEFEIKEVIKTEKKVVFKGESK